ncbi:hypothetical protein SB816_21395 [Achromobacter sp. SIMBA_011]|nr:hypothetical protein [Achromobacter dolens]MBQ2647378.1 hypothetical protein [Achromobacter sp.]MCZ8411488.1 hypothetical protein [Achromobacter dolens]
MPVFQLFNADGSLQFDLSARIPKYLGEEAIGAAAGSVVVGGPAYSDVWFYVVPKSVTPLFQGVLPTISRQGRTISWGARSASSAIEATLIYGIY